MDVLPIKPNAGWISLLSLFLLAIFAFSNSFPGSFIGDDISIVQQNPLVANIDLRLIFTTDYWGQDVNSGLFRPLTILSLSLNRLLFGDSSIAFHSVNLFLHALVTLLFYSVLMQREVEGKIAWIAAALFAVHPIHTEVVNEVVGRAELLAALGLLGALYFSACQRLRPVTAWSLMILAFLAGLLSKENAIVLLGLLPAIDLFYGLLVVSRWREKVTPYGLLCLTTLIWLGWRSWGVNRSFPADGYDQIYTPLASLPLDQRLLTALKFQWLYLRKLLFPFDLQGIYSGHKFFQPVAGIFSFEGIAIVIATLLFAAVVARLYWKRSLLGLGLLFYVIAVAPTANLFFVSGVTFAERLTYLPSLGFCLALAVLIHSLVKKTPMKLGGTLPIALILVLLTSTMLRNPDYRSSLALWEKDVQQDGENVLAWMFLANAAAESGRISMANTAYESMVKEAPDFSEGLRNYAAFLFSQGRFADAIKIGLRVVDDSTERYPTNYLVLGQSYVKTGDFEDALLWLEKLPSSYKEYGVYWEYRGRALEGLGNMGEAIESYRRMGGYPAGSDVPFRLGHLLLQSGAVSDARRVLQDALRENQSSAVGWNSLGVCQILTGDKDGARFAFEQAVRLAPGNLSYQENLKRVSRQ